MDRIYRELAGMTLIELETIGEQLRFHSDPWAVGARKLIAQEIITKRHTEQIYPYRR